MEITKEWVIKHGFKKYQNLEEYRLDLKIPFPGECEIGVIPYLNEKWAAFHVVNNWRGPDYLHTVEEIKELYFRLRGEELKEINKG